MAYVEPTKSGTITRNITTGVDLITNWVANTYPTLNAVNFTISYYLKTTKSIDVKISSYGYGDDISTQITVSDWNGGYYLQEKSKSINYTTSFYENNTFTDGGNAITASITPGTYFICSGTMEKSSYNTVKDPDYFYANDNDRINEFEYNFVFELDKYWTLIINGTTYKPFDDYYTFEIPPINVDRRNTASMPATYLGDFASISIHKVDSSYITTLSYEFGNLSDTIVSQTSASIHSWRIPWEFLSQFTGDSAQATGTLKCITYREIDDKLEYYGETTSTFIVKLDVSIAGPTFAPVVTDTNATTTALTGNNKILVKFFSNASVTSGAAAQGNATITAQSIENSGKYVDGGTATFNKVESGIFKFVATDSRKFTSTSSYTASFIDYSKLTCNLLMGYPSTSGSLEMTIEGNYFNSTFGATQNTLTVQYRYKVQGGSYGSWKTVTVNKSNNYRYTTTLTGFDYKTHYVFQARAVDKLMTVESLERGVIGYPVFDWSKNDFQINVPVGMREEVNIANGQPIIGIDQYGIGKVALTPCDSIGNTVLGYGNYQNANGDTMIYGDNVRIFANNEISFNGTVLDELPTICSGSWTPKSIVSSSPTTAKGNFMRIGDVCIINFYYQAAAASTISKITFTGLPYSPDTSYRWQSGGGNVSGGTLGLDQTAFSGWTIENTDGTWGICGRSVGYRDNTSVATTESSGYVGVAAGSTLYASGTIMYKISI